MAAFQSDPKRLINARGQLIKYVSENGDTWWSSDWANVFHASNKHSSASALQKSAVPPIIYSGVALSR